MDAELTERCLKALLAGTLGQLDQRFGASLVNRILGQITLQRSIRSALDKFAANSTNPTGTTH